MPKYKLLLKAILVFSCTMIVWNRSAQAVEPESCGEQPVHVCIMMDRTGSVSSTERADEAAAAKGLIDQIAALNNGTKVAIGRFGDGTDGGSDAEMRDAEPSTGGFQTFTTNYSQAKTAVDNAMGSSSSVGTNLEDAVEVCRNALIANRAANIQDVMILISDGDTNDRDEASPDGSSENQNENDDDPFNSPIFSDSDYDAALDAAREAKGLDPYLQSPLTTLNPGIRIFTIAFGAESNSSTDQNARKLLALMASGNAQDDHCDDTGDMSCSSTERTTENNDGDDYFISPKTQSELAGVLSLIFQVIQCQDDGNPCTVESCNEDTNLCESETIDNCVPCQTAQDCNDGNDCTTEACVDNRCSISTANDNTPCNDNNLCTDGESCQAGVCGSPTSNVQCSPLDECHVAGVCNPATGQCSNPNKPDGSTCSNDDSCSSGENCQAGICVPGAPISCDDRNDCTADACDAGDDECSHTPVESGTECDDHNICTVEDQCGEEDALGICVSQPKNCDDSNVCTDDTCDSEADCDPEEDADCGCVHTPNDHQEACYSGPEDTEGVGLCKGGIKSCEAGRLGTCEGEVTPVQELCDGLDNDCDGEIDEDFDLGATCDGVDADLCEEGKLVCKPDGSGTQCDDPNDVDVEICDGQDNDCNPRTTDGVQDPGLGKDCDGEDGDACNEGKIQCEGGSLSCSDDTETNVELCNGKDDDCDGSIDEGFDLGKSCDGTDDDLCEEGKLVCKPDGSGTMCDDPNDSDPEVCDGQDNDCNPATTDGVQDPGLGKDCDGEDGDACKEGKLQCEGGSLSCSDDTETNVELCNGKDDDCDGSIDEGFDLGESCDGTDADLCDEGKLVCKPDGSGTQCDDPNDSDPEVCDGQDNDCNPATTDGVQDPSLGKDCDGEDGDVCNEGKLQCEGGSLSCSDDTETNVELCNGQDDDCDGSIDEDFKLGVSCDGTDADLCEEGKLVCKPDGSGTMCDDPNDSDPEVCDGEDNDCDEAVDEDIAPIPTSCGVGVCAANGEKVCEGGTFVDSCKPGLPTGDDTDCDGSDNDCDGSSDNHYQPKETSCGVGACASTGTTSCVEGKEIDSCEPGEGSEDDADCDGVDDDCDGTPDDDYQPQETECGVGACARTGTLTCRGGEEVDSCEEGVPTVEECDGVDNDCDEVVDNGGDELCNDGNPCTDDVCNGGEGGCSHVENSSCEPPPCADQDSDGVCDEQDNCDNTPNPDQADENRNGVGDACEEGGDDSGQGGGPLGPNCLQGSGDFGDGSNGCQGYACSLNRNAPESDPAAAASFFGLLALGGLWLLQRRLAGRVQTTVVRAPTTRRKMAKAGLFGAGALLVLLFQADPVQAGTICFCHATGSTSNPFNTICTSNAGQQNGHTNHGDPDFGCGCGDNVCDPNDGETCGTCPQDCGACPACGDGDADEGEECGDPGTRPGTCTAPETCEGCRCVPPPPVCGNNDQELGEECDGTDSAACGNLGCDNASCQCNEDLCPDDPNKTEPGICGCGVSDADSDGDGTPNCNDGCPSDPNKVAPGVCGCGQPDTDTDGDGTPDCNDQCPNDLSKTSPGICGCGVPDTDSDSDGTPNCNDQCPDDPGKIAPGACGCGVPDTDTDGDGTPDCNDRCPDDPGKTAPGICGCGIADTDSDGDETPDCNDQCPDDPDKIGSGICGCGEADTDSDGDGTADCNDECPGDPDKTAPGICGCGVADTDSDEDGTPDCNDRCPEDPSKTAPGICGCGQADTDSDGDGTPNCNDDCPSDPDKVEPGICGCGVADTDTDGDGTADCNDECPEDLGKTSPGVCGCGTPDTDSDSDGTPNCNDRCPDDANKVTPGACGCGIADTDTDGDGTPNCNDNCPNDPAKVTPGTCGCGVADTDSDGDGTPDCNDECPGDPDKIGSGICGCGEADSDSDGDGTADCNDECPGDPDKTAPGLCGCGVADTDSDEDGTPDCNDNCPEDPAKTSPGICGCGVADTDSDGDGTANCNDDCPNDPDKLEPGICGCGQPDTDTDDDGTADCNDECPDDIGKTTPGVCGCGVPDTDSDSDGTPNCNDQCPDDASKVTPGTCGCGVADTDTDGDGTPNCNDNCPNDPGKVMPGTCGCGVADTDSDGDGTPDCNDECPGDPDKIGSGICGCGAADTDSDGDGTANCNDGCPDDSGKTSPGLCGCGTADTDSDGDGTPDCSDNCPEDPTKIVPGICGCGVADLDSDEDGTANCNDGCPSDPEKVEPGICGCGQADADTDEDGQADCRDDCPQDPEKTAPGLCGCGTADTDSDGDGAPNCNDACPSDPAKTSEGTCGCGQADTDSDGDEVPDCRDNCDQTPNPDQADSNQNGVGDACEEGGDDSGQGGGPTGPSCLQGSGDFGDGANGCQGYACSLNRQAASADPAAMAGLLALGLGLAPWMLLRFKAPGRFRRNPR